MWTQRSTTTALARRSGGQVWPAFARKRHIAHHLMGTWQRWAPSVHYLLHLGFDAWILRLRIRPALSSWVCILRMLWETCTCREPQWPPGDWGKQTPASGAHWGPGASGAPIPECINSRLEVVRKCCLSLGFRGAWACSQIAAAGVQRCPGYAFVVDVCVCSCASKAP